MRRFLSVFLCCIAGILFFSCEKKDSITLDSFSGAPSALFYNGKIVTMTENADGSPFVADAMLVRGGEIAAVGTKRGLLAESDADTVLVDLQGKTVLPGFIDAHSHLSSYSQTLAIADLSGSRDFAEIQKRLSDFLRDAKFGEGEWLASFGYDNNSLAEKRHPDKTVLDAVSTEVPILATHASGHMGVVNSKGMELLGIDKNTPDVAGGFIARDADGNPTGYMEEAAWMAVTARVNIPKTDPVDLMLRAQKRYFEFGITTAQDALMAQKEFDLMEALLDSPELKIDIVGFIDMRNAKDTAQKYKSYIGAYKNHFRIGGYKIFLDGSPQGRTAWLSEPYLPMAGADASTTDGDPAYAGYPVYADDAVVVEYAKTAMLEGMQLQAHCNGDAAADQFIRAIEKAGEETGLAPDERSKPVLIHCQISRSEQFAKMAAEGIIPSLFPAHIWYWGDVHLSNLGEERASRISAAADAKNAGLLFTFHQDTPVIQPDMIETVWCAVNRVTRDGKTLDGGQKISVYDALKAVTINTALQLGEESRKGTLEAGKTADFVVLDKNPLAVDASEIRGIKVLETVKGGEVVFQL